MDFDPVKFIEMLRQIGKIGMDARLAIDNELNHGSGMDDTLVIEGLEQLDIVISNNL